MSKSQTIHPSTACLLQSGPENRQSNILPHYLVTTDAAAYLSLSSRTLEKHRVYGTGPIFYKLGGRVVYAIDDLEAWVKLGMRSSTSDPGTGAVHPAKRGIAVEHRPATGRRK